ncbi:MAG: type I DNA topoisomerase [Armatimonadota bacterium]
MSKTARQKDLIIVESPAKTKTLASFLGNNYDIRASMGHVRDLPKSKIGVDVEHGFEPSYTTIPERRNVISELKKAAENSRTVYLASDPDREGEAIAWHLAEVLKAKNIQRIEFNEITKRAVQDALQHPRTINLDRVNAQQARRVLDRLVGYKLSPLLWKKIQKNLSAGRVQSVALRLVVEREREIQRFVSEEYWSLAAQLTPSTKEHPFLARLVQVAGKKAELKEQESVEQIVQRLGYTITRTEEGKFAAAALQSAAAPEWRVSDVRRKEQKRNPAPPFITSTLQQEAARKLGFSARRAMQTAQQLYEGVELGGQGHVGLITYMRTDSVTVSQDAQAEARDYIAQRHGDRYVPESPRQYKARKGAQEAHEAIRPTSVFRTPDQVREHLTSDQFRLYQLIWLRFVASQMASAVFDVTTVDISVLDLLFRATGRVVKFDGFMAIYTEGRDDRTREEQEEDDDEGRTLPALSESDLLRLLQLLPGQHFTEPPPRFTEATLVRALEEKGIGRPSTYAQILSTILDRGYVLLEEKRFKPTDLGCVVNDQLVRHFPDVVSADFTAKIEQHLDDIATGEREWVQVLQEFYDPFQHDLERAETEMERVKPEAEETDIPCPQCGRNMLIRSSRYGKFLGCSGFPECRHTMQMAPEGGEEGAEETMDCPDCGKPMQKRRGRFGEFWGCTGYPECKKIVDPKKKDLPPPDPDFSMPCPRPGCGGTVTAKHSRAGKVFYGCSNYASKPKCDYVAFSRPQPDQPCETCGFPKAEQVFRGQSKGFKCTNSACAEGPAPAAKKAGGKTPRGRAKASASK